MLDVRRMQVLQVVVESGSVTAAARRLGYTPSAVSQHIAALERATGAKLLERQGRGVRPTPAGRLLADHTIGVLDRLGEAEAALAALVAGRSGRLRIMSFPTAGAALLPQAVATFRRQQPDVDLDLAIAEPPEAVQALRRGDVDIAVVIDHPATDDPADEGLRWHFLLTDPYRVLLPRGHRLARRRAIDLRELADDPWIGTASAPGLCESYTIQACAAAGFTAKYVAEADDYPATQGFVATGLGVALAPLLALGAVHSGIVVKRLESHEPARQVFAVTRPGSGAGAAPAMVAALREAAHQHGRTDRRAS